jgi:hypothetical protein
VRVIACGLCNEQCVCINYCSGALERACEQHKGEREREQERKSTAHTMDVNGLRKDYAIVCGAELCTLETDVLNLKEVLSLLMIVCRLFHHSSAHG